MHSVGIQEENGGNFTQVLFEEKIGEEFGELPTDRGPQVESTRQKK